MNRRTVLKAGFVIAASSHTAIATAETGAVASISIDDFLKVATAAERARYHDNELAEVMEEMHPDNAFRSHIDHEGYFVLIAGTPRKGWGKVAKVYVDDRSPLLPDDVTGTTAFADWEASR